MKILNRLGAGLVYWSRRAGLSFAPRLSSMGEQATSSIIPLLMVTVIGSGGIIFQLFRIGYLYLMINHVIWPSLIQQDTSFFMFPILFLMFLVICDLGFRIGVPIALAILGGQLESEDRNYRR